MSSTDQNKTVVRRFMTEALAGGDADALDELLAPNYRNPMMGGMDRAGFKALGSVVLNAASASMTGIHAVTGRFASSQKEAT